MISSGCLFDSTRCNIDIFQGESSLLQFIEKRPGFENECNLEGNTDCNGKQPYFHCFSASTCNQKSLLKTASASAWSLASINVPATYNGYAVADASAVLVNFTNYMNRIASNLSFTYDVAIGFLK
jgi:hypothetical protein